MGRRGQAGVISLEASISLSLFMFLMLFLYSFFLVFYAQYTIEHALIESGKSLALETYATDKIITQDSSTGSIANMLPSSIGTVLEGLGLESSIKNREFVVYSKWYNSNNATVSTAKERVCAYLGGEETAEKLLTTLRVDNGLDGLDFSGTKVDGDDLYITVTYQSNLIFDFKTFGVGNIQMTLSCRTALWK